MTDKKPNTGLVVRAARAHICPDCPLKWGPPRPDIDHANPCELDCDLFAHLPAITDAAACTDPMLRTVTAASNAAIKVCLPPKAKRQSPLWRNRKRLLGLLAHLFGR
jgi:hypothetical protein